MPSTDLGSEPPIGRVFARRRRVRLGDVDPGDRLRVDAIARYLQDVARDDSADAELPDPMAWVVRRTVAEVVVPPRFQEEVELRTWCSGVGSRWAERRTSVRGERGGRVEAATLWVHLDPRTGRPARLGPGFYERYGTAATGRSVDARLHHRARPPEGAAEVAWQVRAADLDVLGHANNAATAAAVEEVLAAAGWRWPEAPVRVELEHRDPLLPGAPVRLWWEVRPGAGSGGLGVWLTGPVGTHLTAKVAPTGPG